MLKVFFSAMLLFFFSVPLAAEAEQTRSEKRMEKLQREYQPTGKTQSCVSLRSLRDSTIINDQMIMFKQTNKRVYVNKLPNRCRRLMAEERFSYSVSIGQLCKHELITVIDSFGHSWGRCGLGDFEVWEKKPQDDSKDKKEDE